VPAQVADTNAKRYCSMPLGTSPNDIKEFLESYTSQGYVAQEFRLSRCVCGSETFELFADDDEGCAKRICTLCGEEHFICDSEEYWSEATPQHTTSGST